jgi:CNT family concentrative nucleoside transporter
MSETPRTWRLALLAAFAGLVVFVYAARDTLGPRGQSACGFVAFLILVAAFSKNLRRVNRQTLFCGIALQFALAVLVLRVPEVGEFFGTVGKGVEKLLSSANEGSRFVFGNLASYPDMKKVFGDSFLFPFAFIALPPIIFVSGLFSVLYYFGILQFFVKVMATVMGFLMKTSGAETLSVSANVFMGQTEAPLIVKPFVPKMTQSELLALMASGMAHVSGGMMAVYIGYTSGYFGNDAGRAAAAILITCVMACPCSLYLTKLLLPETETPETAEGAKIVVENKFANVIDALSSGISDGLRLALNVAAMLIGFIALITLLNAILGGVKPLLVGWGWLDAGIPWWPDDLTLQHILGWVFRPAALLMGVPFDETGRIGSLLGMKLVVNEHFAILEMTKKPEYAELSLRSKTLAVYALTGFANFSSVGIQLGGIGALAEGRRSDLARLGMRALFIGFIATLVNAAVAGILMS